MRRQQLYGAFYLCLWCLLLFWCPLRTSLGFHHIAWCVILSTSRLSHITITYIRIKHLWVGERCSSAYGVWTVRYAAFHVCPHCYAVWGGYVAEQAERPTGMSIFDPKAGRKIDCLYLLDWKKGVFFIYLPDILCLDIWLCFPYSSEF